MKNKITYHQEEDFLIPDLIIEEQSSRDIGKYGRLKLKYIKENKKGLYTELLINGTLNEYLFNTNNDAINRLNLIINQLAKEEKVDENLKQNDQLEWVKQMDNIKNRAEEIVLNEIIFN